MKRKGYKKIIFIMLAASLLFVSTAGAYETNNTIATENYSYKNSISMYNALENNLSFESLVMRGEAFIETPTEREEPSDIAIEHLAKEELVDITAELNEISEKKDYSLKRIKDAMAAISEESEVKSLLIGHNLGILRFELVQAKGIITVLNDLALKTQDETEKALIAEEIKSLEEELPKAESFVLNQNNKFSLFGWFRAVL